MDFNIILIVVVLCSVLFGIGLYFLLRFLKGSLKFKLSKTSFADNTDNIIEGGLELKAKSNIDSNNLFVALVCYEIRTNYYNGRRSTSKVEIFRSEQVLDGKKVYNKGFKNIYNFKIPFPQNPSQKLGNISVGNEMANNLLNNIISFAKRSNNLKWKLEARLDASGVDLFSSQKVYLTYYNNNSNNNNNAVVGNNINSNIKN